jgi:hypothetical protein
MNVDLSKQRDMWRFLAGEMRHWNAPFFASLCEAIGDDQELAGMALNTRPGQPPTQFIAAVQYLLMRGADHDLKNYFPSLNGGKANVGDPSAALKDFCGKHRDEIVKLISTRATNTNEIARSAGLNAAFRTLATQSPAPLHLVEIGPSAGFNLLWDRYQIRYLRDGKAYATETPYALLTVDVQLREGGIPPLGLPPKIASRVGLELNPVDLEKQEERDWLRAVIHADHLVRHERIKKVLALKADERPEIRGGDALKLLPQALAQIPSGGKICVYHTFAVYQFSPEMQQTLEEIFTKASETRTIWRLSNEWGPNGKCPLTLMRYERGSLTQQTLAYCDIHGTWIEWLN